jgi:7-cyano-7-deazaguanine synthase
MSKKFLFLFGGGIDSVAQVILLRNKYGDDSEIRLLHIRYGQRADGKESEVGIRLVLSGYADGFDTMTIGEIHNSNNPLFTDIGLSEDTYTKDKCEVHLRNAMLGMNGLFKLLNDDSYTDFRDADICFGFYAYTEKGTYPFPDETTDFINRMNAIVDVYGYSNRFIAPFMAMGKKEIWKSAYEIEPKLFDIAWTCYEDGEKQCGVCPHCQYLKKFMKEELKLSDEEISSKFLR